MNRSKGEASTIRAPIVVGSSAGGKTVRGPQTSSYAETTHIAR